MIEASHSDATSITTPFPVAMRISIKPSLIP